MTGTEVGLIAMTFAALVEVCIIIVLNARIAGLEDRYWHERESRIREQNRPTWTKNETRHPLCGGVVRGESDE